MSTGKPRKQHAGLFKPGQSGNPSGRPKIVAEVRDLARVYTVDAVETLVAIMRNGKAQAAARVAAANALLDRGYGKPSVTADVRITRDIADISDAELLAIAAGGGDGDSAPTVGPRGADPVH